MRALVALLLIEDEAVRTAIRFALEVDGIDARICSDLMKVYRLVEPGRTCLVIDQGKDASEALKILRSLRDLHMRLPTIVLVSTPPKILCDSISALGAMIIEKPLGGDELPEAIRALTLKDTSPDV